MSNTNDIVYITVPISQKPEKNGWYYVMNPNKEILSRMIEFHSEEWHNYNKVYAEFWLKPVKISDLLKEAAEKAWDAAIRWKFYEGMKVSGLSSIQAHPDKETYLTFVTKQIKQ